MVITYYVVLALARVPWVHAQNFEVPPGARVPFYGSAGTHDFNFLTPWGL